MSKVIGQLHSFESCGTVDGPGLRFVVFTQGCPLRCLYCHNPDTHDTETANQTMTPEELFEEIKRYKPFIKNGGMTMTGGEPLRQPEFAKEVFKLCKKEGIHTAVDTSGYYLNDEVKLALDEVDMVLLDIKCIDPDVYQKLTSQELERTLAFAQYLKEIGKPTWIRYVLVPEWTDKDHLIEKLADYVQTMPNVERVEVLPYHTMARYKYENLGWGYPLDGIQPPTPERVENAKNIFRARNLEVW